MIQRLCHNNSENHTTRPSCQLARQNQRCTKHTPTNRSRTHRSCTNRTCRAMQGQRRGQNTKTYTKWSSKRTRNLYVSATKRVSDDTERKAATCPDLRTSTEEGTTSEEAHEERGDTYASYTRVLTETAAQVLCRDSRLSLCLHVPCCAERD